MAESYPLSWPEGWARTPDHRRTTASKFNTTFDRARSELCKELRLLGAQSDGMPYSDQARRRLDDPGVAVYFVLRKRQMVMARDAYTSVHDNLRSIGLGIAHLRGLERHGGGTMMERAFEGFAALPPHGSRDCWAVLGLRPGAARDEIEGKFRELVKKHHPDNGGSSDEFMAVKPARDTALQAIG